MNKGDEPAYPSFNRADGSFVAFPSGGLSKREYFAGLAMQGMVAGYVSTYPVRADNTAMRAVTFADALLAELAKEAP